MVKKKNDLTIFSDKPTKKDLLNFKDYSFLLSNLIVNSETPSTIGVFGEWGSGKTSLMMMIEENLQKKNIKTIWFNAWKYDKEEALWRALILSILRGVSTDKKDVDEITLKLYEAVSTERLGQVQIDWLEIGKSLLKGAASFAAPFLLIIPGLSDAFIGSKFLDQVSSAFTRRKIQQSRERISSIEQFEELYQKLISEHVKKGERVVILIDDLDRCTPIRALEVLEALKSFLDAVGCIYVVACDTRLINQGISQKYTEKSGINLDEYLSKIVQFAFTIPPIRIEDAEQFIKSLGWSIGSDEIIRSISMTLDRNPRKLKRFLTDLKIKQQLVKSRDLLLRPETLAKMSCVSYVWKEFWQASLKNSNVFTRAQQIANTSLQDEKSPDDIDFEKTFGVDDDLISLLKSKPLVTDADLHEYIFLSTATAVNFNPQSNNISKKTSGLTGPSSFNLSEIVFSQQQIDALNSITSAIAKGTTLISVSGNYGVGKTTLLRILENTDAQDFVAIYSRLEGLVRNGDIFTKPNDWMTELARQVVQGLSDKGYKTKAILGNKPFSYKNLAAFFANVTKIIKNKKLVIMLDEYDALPSDARGKFDKDLAEMFDFVTPKNSQVVFILCGRGFNRKSGALAAKADVFISLNELTYSKNSSLEYERLMSIPTSDYDLGDTYKLLFLFENELRKLITAEFNKHDWWQRGLSIVFRTTMEERLRRKGEKLKTEGDGLELLSLGELFKIILASDNWEEIFKVIFSDRGMMSSYSSLIVNARNSIAHSRSLSNLEMERFVSTAKELLLIIQNRNITG